MSKAKIPASSHHTNATVLVILAALAVLVAVVIIQYSRNSVVIDTTILTQPSASVNAANSSDFTVLTDATITSSGDITTYHFSDTNVLNVMPLSYKAMVLNETAITSIANSTVGTVPAALLTLRSAKDGSTIKAVQLEHNEKLFDFRGSDEFLNDLAQYVQFNN